MQEMTNLTKELERVVLVGLITNRNDEIHNDEYLDELAFLAETAGGVAIKRFVQRIVASG